jgi:hypothetical protein
VAGGDAEGMKAALAAIEGVTEVTVSAGEAGLTRIEVATTPGKDVRSELARIALDKGANLHRLDSASVNLHELFLSLTNPAAAVVAEVEEAA